MFAPTAVIVLGGDGQLLRRHRILGFLSKLQGFLLTRQRPLDTLRAYGV